MYQIIKEGKAKIKIPKSDKISSKMPVFYNPVMKLNRDITIIFLSSIPEKWLHIGSPLAATGVREIRFLKELPRDKIGLIEVNDIKKSALKLIKENLRLNKIKSKKIKVYNKDANIFLLQSKGFDYIDIDPFGSPNPFLDSAIKRLSSDGYLAVTCTDTASLCGTYPKTCLRKYWALPKNDSNMHETGLRILIRKIQLIGAQCHKALAPVFSYYAQHYFRIYFKGINSKKETDNILTKHGMFQNTGPLWLGKLWDKELATKMLQNSKKEAFSFLKIIEEESKIDTVGFFDVHEVCKKYKIQPIPKIEHIIQMIKSKGYLASRTHFSPNGIRTDISLKEFVSLIKFIKY